MSQAAILLHPDDNILVCRRDTDVGDKIILDILEQVVVQQAIKLGHKIARSHIPTGDPIIKYGMVIGRTTADVPQGSWVHVHNMRSDYIPAHTHAASSSEELG